MAGHGTLSPMTSVSATSASRVAVAGLRAVPSRKASSNRRTPSAFSDLAVRNAEIRFVALDVRWATTVSSRRVAARIRAGSDLVE